MLAALEVLAMYAAILLYIWRWQFTIPRLWMLLSAAMLVSFAVHRDTPRALGLTTHALRANAQLVLPLALAGYVPLVVYGFASHRLILTLPGKRTLFSFVAYGLWCLTQQFLAQSYFHHRLLGILRNPHGSSAIVALMFGAAHIPNPVLMVATTLGGFVFSEVFARHRNIWPLALAQGAGGFLVAALAPASLIHNMRVGPGYFFYGLR